MINSTPSMRLLYRQKYITGDPKNKTINGQRVLPFDNKRGLGGLLRENIRSLYTDVMIYQL